MTLTSCDNCLDKYIRKVGETIDGAKEAYAHPVVTLPDDQQAVWSAANRDAHTAYIMAGLVANTNMIFAFLASETYINGLPRIDYDKLKNKVLITSAAQNA